MFAFIQLVYLLSLSISLDYSDLLIPDGQNLRKKSAIFIISIVGIFLLSFIIYNYIPNPNEFTHLPEYGTLSMVMIRAMDKEKDTKPALIKNTYFLSGLITGAIGTGDEIYQHFLPSRFFSWHDVFLNILGGILGLLIFRVIKR